MSKDEQTGALYLGQLARLVAATPAIRGLYLASHSGSDRFGEARLYLTALPSFPSGLLQWLEPAGETAYTALTAAGADIVMMDGLTITLIVGSRAPGVGWTPLFERENPSNIPDGSAGVSAEPEPDGAFVARVSRFWRYLFAAGAALGQGEPFSAHGDLEECRQVLLALYRTALAPADTGEGYGGIDRLPGAEALAGLTEWLVAPLDIRAQWRCATRLAATYESLMLPLVDRLGLDYPWALRNLAFRRLELVRPELGEEGATEAARQVRSAPAVEAPAGPPGPARFKVKLRRRAEGE
ncbi:MAG: hypothetical protein ACM3XM_10085 [Mycobacterium leprae]